MGKNSKVLWFEGMTLDPHHFQQWDRFHQMTINFLMRSISPNSWGVLECNFEREALLNGNYKILKLCGIMPDGLFFNLPDNDPLPLQRSIIEHFPTSLENLPVYLAIPNENSAGRNFLLTESSESMNIRYNLENIIINDENTGHDQRQIAVARANFRIIFGTETTDGFNTLKIAEIIRTSEGEFSINENYIPPCLFIAASDCLFSILRGLLEFFIARSNALRNRRRQTEGGQWEITTADLPLYWHLSAINSYIPYLKQYVSSGKYHPQFAYDSLLSLAGLLTSYSSDETIHPGDLAVYDHYNLTGIFTNIENKIRRLLGEMVPQKSYFKLDLEKLSDSMYQSQIKDSLLFKDIDFFLICSGEIPVEKLINELPTKLRIASPDMINEVLRTATRALTINYSPSPPQGMARKTGLHYLKLEKKGPFWAAIEKSQSLVIYIPAEFQDLNLELIAVKRLN